jgi:hypothetical protein
MPQEIIANRIKLFTPEYSDFVFSDFTEVMSTEINSQYRLSEDQKVIFENAIFLYITLFLNRFQFVEFIVTECYLPIATSTKIVSAVLSKMPADMVSVQSAILMEITADENTAIKEKNRLQLLNSTPALIHPFIYTKTNPIVGSLINKYSLVNDEVLESLHMLLGDIMLGFYKIEDTVPLLQQELGLDARTAALLGADVLDFLTPLSDPNWQPPATIENTTTNSTTNVPEVQTETTLVNPEITAVSGTSQVLDGRSPIRSSFTPLEDSSVPVHSSTQEATRAVLSDLPSYNAPLYQNPKPAPDGPLERPRWGS